MELEQRPESDVAPMAATTSKGVHSAHGLGQWRGWDLASLVLLGAIAVLMIVTVRDYGFTYDEPPHIRYGNRILEFYASGFRVRRSLVTSYVGGFDIVAALLRQISPLDEYVTNHVLCIFVAQCGLLGAWKLGRLLGGPLGGLCSLLILVLTPVYYSHQFNNPKDVPFAAGYIWGLYFIAKLLVAHARGHAEFLQLFTSRAYFARLGLTFGLGMSVRVGGALLIGYFAVAMVAIGVERFRQVPRPEPLGFKRVATNVGLACFIAWALLVAFWPRAMLSPLQGPAAAARSVSHYRHYNSPTLLRGELVPSQDVPWDYMPTYFLVQLPEFTLLVFGLALGWWSVSSWRSFRDKQGLPLGILLVGAAALVPPTFAILRGSTLYDGLRHFLFIIPPIAVVCGVTFGAWVEKLSERSARLAQVLGLVGVLFVVDQAVALAALHPYQHVFFNRMSGGTQPAVKRYETEYYGALYQELGARLAQELWEDQPNEYLNRSYRVAICGSNLFLTKNMPLNFRYQSMGQADHADLFATYPRDRCLERFTGKRKVLDIQRRGATLGIVRELKQTLKDGAPL